MSVSMSIPSHGRWTGVLCGLASALIWGAFPVVTRLGITRDALDAYDITCIRYTVSGLILLPFLLRRGLMGLDWKAIALMVAGIGAPYMLVVALGLAMAPVEQFAVVTPASMILFSAAIGAWGFGARLPPREKAGLALIVGGVALAGYHVVASAQTPPAAYLVFLGGGLLWAVYTVSSQRLASSAQQDTAVVSVFSMALYLPPYLAVRGLRLFQAPLMDIEVQALYQGVLVSTVALFLFSKAVQLLGASTGATFAALVPGSAILLASLMLGERPGATIVLGLLVVTAGMALTLFRPRGRDACSRSKRGAQAAR
jgi:drug/metabolite transporter (DMT)-like permease